MKAKYNTPQGEAAKALGRIGNERAVEPLIRALNHGNENVRECAAKVLWDIKDLRAIEPLIQALKLDPYNWRVERNAVDTLRKIGEPAVEPLIRALKHKDVYVRENAAKALGMIRDERAVEPLIRVVLEDVDWEDRRMAAKALVKIGKPSVELLIPALKDWDKDVREIAAEALGEIGDKRAVQPLIHALKDDVRA